MGKFSDNMRQIRKRRGLTQDQAGEACGLSGKYVGELERGEASPTLETIEKVARGLRVDMLVLIGDDADRLASADVRAEILKGLEELDDERARELLRLVRLMLRR